MRIDPLSAVMLFFVAWTVLMIFIYSIGYHNFGQPKGDHDRPGLPPHGATVSEHGQKHNVPSIEPMYSRFFAFIGLFAFGMYHPGGLEQPADHVRGLGDHGLVLVPADRFLVRQTLRPERSGQGFHDHPHRGCLHAAGDRLPVLGTGSLTFTDIFKPEVLEALAAARTPILGLSAAGLIGLLLFIGTVGKSAQWPLHVWLPDAMEGPTPVSAMIHAATMVSAGVYAVIRMFPLLSLDPDTR